MLILMKEVAVLLSKVIKHAQNKKWTDVGEALLRDAQSLISAGKTAVKNPEAQSDFYEVVNTTLANIKGKFLWLCVCVCLLTSCSTSVFFHVFSSSFFV